jgi:hypothetical protein
MRCYLQYRAYYPKKSTNHDGDHKIELNKSTTRNVKTKDDGLHFRQHFDAVMEKFLTNYKGPPSKKCKTDEEVRIRQR